MRKKKKIKGVIERTICSKKQDRFIISDVVRRRKNNKNKDTHSNNMLRKSFMNMKIK